MAISIQEIINSSRNYDEAVRSFKSNYPNPTSSQGTQFMSAANSRFPVNSSSTSNTTNPRGDEGSRGFKSTSWFHPIDKAAEIAKGALETQEQSGYMPSIGDEAIKASSAVSELIKNIGEISNPLKIVDNVLDALAGQAELYFKQQTELLGVINKNAGLTGQFSKDVREELTEANPALLRLGIGFDQLATSAEKLITNSGRFITLNRESWESAGKAATAYVGTLSELVDMYPDFEKIGIGAGDVAKNIEIVGNRSLSLGLQSKKTISELNTNLSKINEYGFKNGIKGLSEMVMKSTEFRISMQSTFDLASKVMNPEGAIDMAANLMAIGGAIGDLGDPLKMMYMATNNVEGLQDALIGAASSLATYNREQGKFEITGINIRKASAMATELGINYGELTKGAIAAAERMSATTDLMSRGLKMDDDTKEFITNISQMKDGKMSIELNSDKLRQAFGDNHIDLENLTQENVEKLKKYQDEFKKMSSDDIIKKQATSIENIMRDVNFIAATARLRVAKSGGNAVDAVKKFMGYDEGDLEKKVNEAANKYGNVPDNRNSSDINKTQYKTEKIGGKSVDNKPRERKDTANINSNNGSSRIEMTIKSDVPLDKLSGHLINDPSFAHNLISTTNKREFTNITPING